jgi:hypothetical protein
MIILEKAICVGLPDQAMPSASGMAFSLRRGQAAPFSGRSANTQNEVWIQEARKGPVSISLGKPGRDGKGIMLIPGAVSAVVERYCGLLRASRAITASAADEIVSCPNICVMSRI